MLSKRIVLIFYMILSTLVINAKVYELNLDQSLQRGKQRSHDMKILRQDLKSAKYGLKAATHMFRTQVDMNFTSPNYTETIREYQDSLGTYYSHVKRVSYEGNVTINQPLPTDGRVYLKSGLYSLNDYNRSTGNAKISARIGFTQPLEAFFVYNSLQASLKKAKLKFKREEKRLKRTKLEVEYKIKQYFYQLVKARERKKIARQTLENQKKAYELAQNKYKAGVIPEVEAMQMEVDLGQARNNYQSSIMNEKEISNRFKQLMDISLSDSVVLNYKIKYNPIYVEKKKAIQLGLKNRFSIQEQEIRKKLARLNIRQTKMQGRISGKISGYYDFQGVETQPLPPTYRDMFTGAYDQLASQPGNRGVSLKVSIPVWDAGVNQARVQKAKVNLEKAEYALEHQKIEIKKDIISTINKIKTSYNNLKLLEKNKKVAQKSYDISQKRFENGDINSQNLAQERERLNQTYISYLDAFINYKLAQADLKRKTFYNFRKNKSLF